MKIKAKNYSRVKNSMFNFATGVNYEFVALLLKFIRRTVFIYVLGKQFLGISSLFTNILSVLSLANLGIGTAIAYRLYKPLATGDQKRVRILRKFYRQAYRLIGAVIFVLGLCLIPLLPTLIKDYSRLSGLGVNPVLIYLLYLMRSVSSYLFFAYYTSIIGAAQKQYITNVTATIYVFVYSIAEILILLFTRNYVAYVAIVIVLSLVRNVVNAIIAKKMFPWAFQEEEESLGNGEIIEMLKDCGAIFLFKIQGIVLKATDNIVLSAFLGLETVAMYSNYYLLYTTLTAVMGKFYSSISASLGNLFASEGLSKKYQIFRTMNFVTMLLSGTACVGIALTANEIIECWLGREYLIAEPLALMIGVELLFAGIKHNLDQVRSVAGVYQQMWYRPVIAAILNIAISLALVRPWGVYGVIAGTIAADVFGNFMLDPSVVYRYCFEGKRRVSEYYLRNLKYFALLLAVGLADLGLCRMVLPGRGWLSAISHVLICGASVPAAFLLVYRNAEECRYLMGKARLIAQKGRKRICARRR